MNAIKKLEALFIDTIAAVTPWLAPLIPAYLVYHNMTERLGYPALFGLVGAAAVEFLGLSAVHTAITFWTWNDSHKADKAPVWIAVGAGAFYVLIVLLVNAGLDIWRDDNNARIAAHALLSLLSVDAAIIIAVRAQHARRLTERDEARQERKAARNAPHDAPQNANDAPHNAKIKTYVCGLCAEGFDNSAKLAAHMRWQHTNRNGHSVTDTVSTDTAQS